MILSDKAIKRVAKTAVFNANGQILVLTRSNTDKTRPGGLDFPGGEIDPGEDILQGASREIQEEIGILIAPQNLQVIYTNAADKNEHNTVVLRFLCVAQVKDPVITLSFEHSAYEWMDMDTVIARFEVVSWAQGLRFGVRNALFAEQ